MLQEWKLAQSPTSQKPFEKCYQRKCNKIKTLKNTNNIVNFIRFASIIFYMCDRVRIPK